MPQDPTPGSTLPRSPDDPQGEVRGAEAGQSHAEARRRGAEICSVARIEKKSISDRLVFLQMINCFGSGSECFR